MSNMDKHMMFRMSSRDKMLIETAAKLKGLKPNTYARQRLLEIAEKDIEELSRLNSYVASDKEWEFFLEIMEAPVQVNENLQKAVSKFNRIVKKK